MKSVLFVLFYKNFWMNRLFCVYLYINIKIRCFLHDFVKDK